ncbi:MAG: hypothetical protein H7338_02270 [Candidatus Sericytochromatia bacterium]|nr:hypothetical protein [Candidatus Sericytochromatia bacterium]
MTLSPVRSIGLVLAVLAIGLPIADTSAASLVPVAADLQAPVPAHPVAMRFAIVKTAEASSKEGPLYAQGDPFKAVTINYSAVLVQHSRGTFLFDT